MTTARADFGPVSGLWTAGSVSTVVMYMNVPAENRRTKPTVASLSPLSTKYETTSATGVAAANTRRFPFKLFLPSDS